jgi:hypothetical protein
LQRGAANDRALVELRPVAALKVLYHWLGTAEVDPDVLARQHRVIDGHVCRGASPDDYLVTDEVDLLKMKS